MHADPALEPSHPEAPPVAPEPPSAGEWAIGITFVLAAVAVVLAIGLSLAGLLP